MITQEMYDKTVAYQSEQIARLERYIREQNTMLIPTIKLLQHNLQGVQTNYNKLTFSERNLISPEEWQLILKLIKKVTGEENHG